LRGRPPWQRDDQSQADKDSCTSSDINTSLLRQTGAEPGFVPRRESSLHRMGNTQRSVG